jgi:hypothetical protein
LSPVRKRRRNLHWHPKFATSLASLKSQL